MKGGIHIIVNKEALSVAAVQTALAKSEYLDVSGIKQGDRTPSWDGEIIVYNNKEHKVENVDGRLSVQIKGIEVKSLEIDTISYPVRTIDLINYLNDGGIFYFVVGITEEGRKVYYRTLAPFDINEILNNIKNDQETKTIDFYPFPYEKDEISTVVITFLHDCRKQTLIREGKNILEEDVANELGLDNFTYEVSFTGIGYEQRDPMEYFLEHDAYLYFENKALNISFPVKLLKKADIIETVKSVKTQIGEVVYFTEVRTQLKRDGKYIHLGTCVTLVIHNDGKLTMSFHPAGNLEERLLGEKFMLDFITQNRWTIDGKQYDLPFNEDELCQTFDVERLEKEIRDLTEIKETLDHYGVTEVLQIDGLTKQDITHLSVLTNARKNGKVRLNEKVSQGIHRLKVNNLQILVVLSEVNQLEYTINNLFKVTLPCKVVIDGQKVATSQYIGISILDFSIASNIDYKKIIKDVTLYDTDEHIDQMRIVLLKMLRAYDDTNIRVLIENASKLAKKLNKTKGACIDLLNVLQCNKRLRTLRKNEIRELKEIVKNETDVEVLTAAYLLLDEQDRAMENYQLLSSERKESFDSYPINRFRSFSIENNN